tara:strand:+ start:9005 stop:9328 length:324 start_codon:yes stop_codon:yes gene_type:complete
MTATATSTATVKDKELVSFGLVEAASVNSISDFNSPNVNQSKLNKEKEKEDFINTFICHLIFYTFFCVSLILHILIDLGLGSFVRNKFVQLFGQNNNHILDAKTLFA